MNLWKHMLRWMPDSLAGYLRWTYQNIIWQDSRWSYWNICQIKRPHQDLKTHGRYADGDTRKHDVSWTPHNMSNESVRSSVKWFIGMQGQWSGWTVQPQTHSCHRRFISEDELQQWLTDYSTAQTSMQDVWQLCFEVCDLAGDTEYHGLTMVNTCSCC